MIRRILCFLVIAGVCSAQKPLALDCSKNPTCPPHQICTCLPGTEFPFSPWFEVDERYGNYKFIISLEKGWNCAPVYDKKKEVVTVTCKKEQP